MPTTMLILEPDTVSNFIGDDMSEPFERPDRRTEPSCPFFPWRKSRSSKLATGKPSAWLVREGNHFGGLGVPRKGSVVHFRSLFSLLALPSDRDRPQTTLTHSLTHSLASCFLPSLTSSDPFAFTDAVDHV